jgi:rRNA maturation endonuclease Nob1
MLDYISMVERVLSKEVNESVSVFKAEIDALSKILYNVNCGNCDNKRTETYIKLYKDMENITSKIKAIMERNYELKDNVVMTIPQLGLTVSNHNLTDKIAEEILKFNPACKAQFKKFPVEGTKPEPPKEVVKPKSHKKKPTVN